ncbi:MAG TPA: DUF72 domain-containing protein [Chitinophagales bacterium]|nr:DUF72 domain-containing protein [Chitinophagales bacterium]HNL06982.1 DUF72 domain-containing protein [Chitinophagales bacterium]
MIQNYYLGGPVWANKDWIGHVFPSRTNPSHLLYEYAKLFNTVEGSTTFYHQPTPHSIVRWYEDTPDHFRFSFKFPRQITHDNHLRNSQRDTTVFLRTIEQLLPKIGNLFLQLPPTFDRHGLATLKNYLLTLPNDFVYAVEVRHLDYYHDSDTCHRLNDLLQELGINRALFDTSELHQIKSNDPDILTAQRKKPTMPEYFVATAQQPFLRYVGHKTVEPNRQRLQLIAQKVAEWINKGYRPFVYFHTPNDLEALHLARFFHHILQTHTTTTVGTIPPFASDQQETPTLFG